MKNRTKKIIALLVVAMALAALIPVLSACNPTYENTDLEYRIEENGDVTIIGYTDSTLRDTIVIPDEIEGKPVTKVADFGIVNAETLKSITIGKNVREIGSWAFTNNQGLKEFLVAEGNEWFVSVDGVLYTKDMKKIVAFPPLKGVELNAKKERLNPDEPVIYTIPEGVETVGSKAFYKCGYVEGVIFPSTLVTIEEKAFHRCGMLKNITLPEGLKTIGKDAFAYCQSGDFNTIVIPASVETIGEYAFYNSTSLKTITMYKTEAQREALEEAGTWGKKWYPTDNGRTIKDINYIYAG